MANFKAQVDLFLTEISIELLGNKIYDINGKRQDKIINLFKAVPEVDRDLQRSENSNDLLCSLGYKSDFSEDETTVNAFLNEQLDFILQDANTSNRINLEIINFLRDYKKDQAQLLADASDVKVFKMIEKAKLTATFNKNRINSLKKRKPYEKQEETLESYYAQEKETLLKLSMDTLRLIKYIINDPMNESVKGELIGFIHAMRNTTNNEVKLKPYNRKVKPLPEDQT